MDQHHDTTLIGTLLDLPSRRDVVRGLTALGFGLSALRLPKGAAARKRRHKRRKKKSRRPASTPPFCANQEDDALCAGGKCLRGVCNPTPTCSGGEQLCATSTECCSGQCTSAEGGKRCQRGGQGAICLDGDDCISGVCTGHRCVDTGCLFNHDYCLAGQGTCHNGGFCLRPVDEGGPRCAGDTGGSGVCDCTTHQECVAALGVGAFCARDTGPHCACATAPSFCVAPR